MTTATVLIERDQNLFRALVVVFNIFFSFLQIVITLVTPQIFKLAWI